LKLLITGGCGFLGSNLAADALSRSDEVMLFDNLSRYGSRSNLDWLKSLGEVKFQHGDIRCKNDIETAISSFQPDVVFHLSGQVAMTTSISNPQMDFEINVIGSYNLLESVRKRCPEAVIIYSSTNKVYGDLEQYTYLEEATRYVCVDQPKGFDESVQISFQSPYGCSKGAADQYMLDYAHTFGLKTVVFRHSSMYGGRQFATYDQGWVGWFCQKAIEVSRKDASERFTISGNGKQVRDVLHADDMKRLYFSAVLQIDKAKGQAFNIGGGLVNSLSLLELFSLLEENTGVRLSYDKLPARDSDQRVFIANIDKAKNLLEWEPKVTAPEGVSAMLEWTSATNTADSFGASSL
jgi:CDP-paratose 2-epimerase